MKIKIALGVVLLLLVVAVTATLLTAGGDDAPQSARDKTTTTAKGADKPTDTNETEDEQSDDPDDTGGATAPPLLRTFASDRADGLKASAQADAVARRPKEIWLRVSAAPKQKVTVSWNLTCGKGADAIDSYVVTPPDIRRIGPPKNKNKVCPVSAAAQLDKTGRLKVALLRDR